MRFLNTRMLLVFAFISLAGQGYGQYFQFSQFNFTPQRVNPALVSGSNYILSSFDFRNQKTGGDFDLTSNSFSISYPFINRKGQRWSGIGFSFLDDRSGFAGVYSTQEVAVSYGVTVPIVKFHSISFGMKLLYLNQNADLTKLFTESQYVGDRGFDPSVDNGEPGDRWHENTFTISSGMYWQNTDKRGNKISYAGFSFFDFNKSDVLWGNADGIHTTMVLMAGQRVYTKDKISVFPEILYTVNSSNHILNAGVVTSYELKSYSRELPERIDFISKYILNKSALVGVQLHRRNFAVGVSYDIPVGKQQVSNQGAIEVGLEWKKLVSPLRSKKKKKKRTPATKTEDLPRVTQADSIQRDVEEKIEVKIPAEEKSTVEMTLSEKLKVRQDSVLALADAGLISHESFELDKTTLHFNFEFNSAGIGNDASDYLDQLADALHDNPDLNVRLVGHTDNVGSDKFNMRLSVERARAVYDYLVKKGIEADRIKVEGSGMRMPLNSNATEAERALNRRVELTILYEDL